MRHREQGIFHPSDMKNILLFLLWSAWGQGLLAQSITFAKYHVHARGIAVETLPHGYAYTGLNYCENPPNAICSVVVVTDTFGNMLHQKDFYRLNIEGLRYRPQDSTFFIWGERVIPNSGGDWAVVLLKTTFRGDTIWSFQYNEDNFDWCRNIVELPDGSILMACAFRDADKGAKLAKVSPEGKLLWTRSYDTGNAFRVYDPKGILDLGDGTVMMSALGIEVDTTSVPWAPPEGISLFKIDYDGNLVWGTAHQTGDNAQRQANPRLIRLRDGQLVSAIGIQQLGPGGCFGNCASFIRVNPDGSIKKLFNFPDEHINAVINDFDDMPDGNFVGCGGAGYEVYGKSDVYASVFKFSPEGKMLWERFLPIDTAYVVGDVKATPDGGCIVIGTQERLRPGGGYEYYAALIKLDGEGCLQPGCDSLLVISPVRELPAPVVEVLHLQPNPASRQVTVTLSDRGGMLHVVGMLGTVLQEVPVSGSQVSISTADLPAGLYFIRQ
ncbi:MAG TPA: hypothetical protein PK858_00005, partial [Saprospiraceae bacterium]|nr:hypothetical protein [Saprospiraceae bacterium]